MAQTNAIPQPMMVPPKARLMTRMTLRSGGCGEMP
jgi:hypothetical protein